MMSDTPAAALESALLVGVLLAGAAAGSLLTAAALGGLIYRLRRRVALLAAAVREYRAVGREALGHLPGGGESYPPGHPEHVSAELARKEAA